MAFTPRGGRGGARGGFGDRGGRGGGRGGARGKCANGVLLALCADD